MAKKAAQPVEKEVKGKETEEQLKKKVDSLVDIIEELSSNVDKNGLPEVENLIDTKLKEMNEKFELKFQDIKTVLDNIEKKAGRGKSKEEISTLVEEFKKTLEPRLNTIEDRLKTLDAIETINEKKEDEGKDKQNKQVVDTHSPNYEIESIKRNVSEINQSLSGLKEQMDIIRNGVKAQGLIDSSDIQKLENILSSIDEMIPQKNVIDNFRVAFKEINDLKHKINEFRSDLQRVYDKQKDYYDDIGSRLETLVKFLNAVIEDRDRYYNELSKSVSDNLIKSVNAEKNTESISSEVKEIKEILRKQNERIKELEDNVRILSRISEKEIKEINHSMKKISDESNRSLKDLYRYLDKNNQIMMQNMSSLNKKTEEQLKSIEKTINDGLTRNNDLIKIVADEKKGLEKAIDYRKQKIVNILKELRK
ncbi:MAG: hypothetical protein N3D75_02680 [Candidatus Aenigmarchaeota archaeon]|nr:hypothetical protein [Candidatus Aenigmarchaeota archaeon]